MHDDLPSFPTPKEAFGKVEHTSAAFKNPSNVPRLPQQPRFRQSSDHRPPATHSVPDLRSRSVSAGARYGSSPSHPHLLHHGSSHPINSYPMNSQNPQSSPSLQNPNRDRHERERYERERYERERYTREHPRQYAPRQGQSAGVANSSPPALAYREVEHRDPREYRDVRDQRERGYKDPSEYRERSRDEGYRQNSTYDRSYDRPSDRASNCSSERSSDLSNVHASDHSGGSIPSRTVQRRPVPSGAPPSGTAPPPVEWAAGRPVERPLQVNRPSLSQLNHQGGQVTGSVVSDRQVEPTVDLRALFDEVDRHKRGYLTERELSKALVNGDYTLFDAHTVRLMMKMFDRDGDGAIYFAEFGQLWKYLHDWRGVFDRFNTSSSDTISFDEFSKALAAFGYTLSPACLQFMFNAGSKLNRQGQPEMSFDMFVQSCISIKSITDTFKKYDTDRDGFVTMGFEDFLIETTKLH